MNLFPMFLKLAGRRCLVGGAGTVGESKIASLLKAGAVTTAVAAAVTDKVNAWTWTDTITWVARPFSTVDLEGAFLAVAATSQPEVHDLVFREAGRRGILCNVLDDPARCDFYCPALLHRGQEHIAISTGELRPALAQRLRHELETQFSPNYGAWFEELAESRRRPLAISLNTSHRRRWLHQTASREAFFQRLMQKRAAEGRLG